MLTGINQLPKDMPAAEAMKLAARLGFRSFSSCAWVKTDPSPDISEPTPARRRRRQLDLVLPPGTRLALPADLPTPRARGIEANTRALNIARWLAPIPC